MKELLDQTSTNVPRGFSEWKKVEKFGMFRGNFPNPNQRWLDSHQNP